MWQRRCGSLKGSTRRNRSLIKLKMAVFSPMPSASVRTAIKVNPGDLRSWRKANFRSATIILLHDPSVAQLNDAVSVAGVFLGMRDLHNRCPVVVSFFEQIHD